jgi:hypothetical protein
MTRLRPALLGLALVIAYGTAEGVVTHRWAGSDDLDRASARLAAVPLEIGEWEGTARVMNPKEAALAELHGYAMGEYTRKGMGDTVSVLLVCGRGGPITLHTPDVCFAGLGYELRGEPERHPVPAAGGGPAEFWAGRFEKPGGVGPQRLTILWGWSTGGEWEAADTPRLRYGRAPVLYKLYFVHALDDRAPAPAADAVLADFVRAFLPAARAVLNPPPAE